MASKVISTKDFRSRLSETVSQRKIWYKIVFAISIIFEADDTLAADDAKSFRKGCLDLLEINESDYHLLVIPKDIDGQVVDGQRYLTNILIPRIYSILDGNIKGRKLLMLHYAGHGTINPLGGFEIHATRAANSQYFNWYTIDERLLRPLLRSDLDQIEQVDICCILDCCHAGGATRSTQAPDRTVEILAAVDEHSFAKPRQTQPTFTQVAINALRTLANTKETTVTLARLYTELTKRGNLANQPVHKVITNNTPILLPLKVLARPPPIDQSSVKRFTSGTRVAGSMTQRPKQPYHDVVLKIHSPTRITEQKTSALVAWLLSLDSEYEVQVQSVFNSRSTVIFLTVPYEKWFYLAQIETLEGFTVEIVCGSIRSRNLLQDFISNGSAPVDIVEEAEEEGM